MMHWQSVHESDWPLMAEIEGLAASLGANRFDLHDGLLGAKSVFTWEWRKCFLYPELLAIDYSAQVEFESNLKEIRRKERERKARSNARRRADRLKREAEHKALLEYRQREEERLEREEAAKRAQLAAAEVARRLAREQAVKEQEWREYRSRFLQLADGSIWLRRKTPADIERAFLASRQRLEYAGVRDIQALWRATYDRSLHKF